MPTVKSFYRQKKKKGAGVTKPSPSSSKTKRSGKASKTPAIESFDPEDGYGEDEDRLRRFDMDMKYGPCIGLTRLERLQRASSMGLEPPAEVVELLLRRSNPAAIECVWQGRV